MFDFGKRNIMTMNYTRYLALPKTWIDAMRLGKGDQVKIEMDNENRLVITPSKEQGALPDVNLPGLDRAALQPTPNEVAAND